jgi:ABC-type phosphate transport system permease subunit
MIRGLLKGTAALLTVGKEKDNSTLVKASLLTHTALFPAKVFSVSAKSTQHNTNTFVFLCVAVLSACVMLLKNVLFLRGTNG